MSTMEQYCTHCGALNTLSSTDCFACGRTLTTDEPAFENTKPAHILHQRYRLLDVIGEGGFSAVYKAQDSLTDNYVAVKAISLRGLKAQEKIEATDAFNREVEMLSTLQHRNLPRLYDHFTDTECWYLVMDFIDGVTLEQRLEHKGKQLFPLTEVFDIVLLLCDLLSYLHHQDPAIIFRDLKPGNIMLTSDGHLFLIDFGIARRFKPGQARDTIPFGSPGYASPEQYGRFQTTPHTDIYSLGAILHQLLSGRDPSLQPFSFPPLHSGLADLDELVQTMVSLDINKRPQSIDFVRNDLQHIAEISAYERGLSMSTASYYTPGHTPYQPLPVGTSGQQSSTQQGVNSLQTGATSKQPLAQHMVFAQPYPPIGPSQTNYYALASLVLSIFGIVVPVILSGYVLSVFVTNSPHIIAWLLVVCMPLFSIASVICGHVALARVRSNPALQGSRSTVIISLTIGYIFTILYTMSSLCTLSFLIVMRY